MMGIVKDPPDQGGIGIDLPPYQGLEGCIGIQKISTQNVVCTYLYNIGTDAEMKFVEADV